MLTMTLVTLSMVIAHPPLPVYEEVADEVLVEAAVRTWALDEAKARILVQGAKLGGRLGGVHPGWLLSMAYFESRFKWRVRGDCSKDKKKCKAYGLCQIHYPTAKSVAGGIKKRDLLDPLINLVVAGLLYGKYIQKHGRNRAHVIYACGRRCKNMKTTPTFHKRYRMALKFIENVGRVGQ